MSIGDVVISLCFVAVSMKISRSVHRRDYMKRHELAGKRKRVFAAVLSAAVMMSSIAPGATVYAEDVIIEEEPGTESGMIETYGAEDEMGAAAGYDDVNGAGSGVSDAAVSSGEAGSTSGAVIEEGANADGINASENTSADDDLAMQSMHRWISAGWKR